MQTKVGTKVTITIPNGTRFPAVVVGAEEVIDFTLRSGDQIEVIKADVISLRTRRENPDESYLYYSNETVMFGYKPQMQPRHNTVIGLDATEEGEVISLQALLDAQGAEFSAFLAGRAAERNPVTDAADL